MGREQSDEKMTNYKTKTVTAESSIFFFIEEDLRARDNGKLG